MYAHSDGPKYGVKLVFHHFVHQAYLEYGLSPEQLDLVLILQCTLVYKMVLYQSKSSVSARIKALQHRTATYS